MDRSRTRKIGVLTMAATLVLAACSTAPGASPGSSQAAETTIYFGTGATQAEVYMLPMLTLGRDALEAEGITLEYAALSSDETVAAALDRGRVDVALMSLLGAQRAVKAGLGLKWTVTNETQNTFVLVVPSDVDDLADLKGKKLGVQDATSLSSVVLPALMIEAGVQPDEYETVFLAGSSNRAAALAAGTMDASILLRDVAVRVQEETNGAFKIWGSGAPALEPMMWEGFVMSDAFRENKTLATAFAKAALKAYGEFYEGDPAALAEEMIGRELPENAGLEVDVTAEDFRQYQEIKLFPTDGGLDEALFTRMNDLLVEVEMLTEADTVPYADLVDTSILEAAQQ